MIEGLEEQRDLSNLAGEVLEKYGQQNRAFNRRMMHAGKKQKALREVDEGRHIQRNKLLKSKQKGNKNPYGLVEKKKPVLWGMGDEDDCSQASFDSQISSDVEKRRNADPSKMTDP